jgi:hypothetical protein
MGHDLRVREAVLRAVHCVCESHLQHPVSPTPDTSLVDDVGMDSFLFVELAVALENELGHPNFPLQVWADTEARRSGRRYTVQSLIEHALNALGTPGSEVP